VDILEILSPNNLLCPIVLPAIVGLLVMLIPKPVKWLREVLSLATTGYLFYVGINLFGLKTKMALYPWAKLGPLDLGLDLVLNRFTGFVTMFVLFFGLATVLYSIGYFRKEGANPRYYGFILWTLSAAVGVVLSDNLLMLLIFWEVATVMLYLLVNLGKNNERTAAAKSFAILGFSDAVMTFGIIIVGVAFGTLSITKLSVIVNDFVSGAAFIMLFVGAIAKSGAIPLHSWLPTIAESAPTPVMAFLPASLDKLLGIFFLARIVLDMFRLNNAMNLILMVIGAITIIAAVMMALVQHDLKKLLSYHAVSQVGYMVLGIGTGTVVGILGGIFHMLNNAIYKNLLFLNAGSIERQTGTTELDKLGGLAKLMPITFITTVIASFSISGIPPLNGFFSKWMIYRGIIDVKSIIFIAAAMFGSALTLASFVKVLHSTFLGVPGKKYDKVKEVSIMMTLPMIVLALLCIVFGVFASYPLTNYIVPAYDNSSVSVNVSDVMGASGWAPDIAALLIIIGLFVGLIVFYLAKLKKVRRTPVYIGGEKPDMETMRYAGTDFYETVKKMGIFKVAYEDAEKGWYDPYNIVAQLGNFIVKGLRKLHNGVLSTYLSWCLIGLAVLLIFLLFKV
jgi:NADH:ubiquinone oxidoreductase subunit 5 (subunit L)/multisubunit Na+/H+ antiporter MnhA subunit